MADHVEFINYDFRDEIHSVSKLKKLPITKALEDISSSLAIAAAAKNYARSKVV